MAETIIIREPYEPVEPKDPIDPTNCPTCLSGFQPTDPPYDDTIDPKYDYEVR